MAHLPTPSLLARAATLPRSVVLSLVAHGVAVGALFLALPAGGPPRASDARVAVRMPAMGGEVLETEAAEESMPVPDLSPPAEPEVDAEDLPDLVLEPLAAHAEGDAEPLPEGVSLSVVGRRTRPEVRVLPSAAPAPAAARPVPPRVPVVQPAPSARASAAAGSLQAELRLVYRPPFAAADYPAEARAVGAQGTAYVRIRIGESGLVEGASLLESSGHPALDADALRRARLHRFAPLQAPRAVRLPVRYRLD